MFLRRSVCKSTARDHALNDSSEGMRGGGAGVRLELAADLTPHDFARRVEGQPQHGRDDAT